MRFNFFTYKDSAKREQEKMKSQRIYIFHAELQPILSKDLAKREQDKMKSRRICIFHAELQPIFAKGCTNSLHPSIIHHYILINFHHPPIAHISSPIGARQIFLTKEASFAERRERFCTQAK